MKSLKSISNIRPIIVSNRLPVKLEFVNNNWEIQPGSGGLITALAPVLKNNRGIWIGWPGGPINDELKILLEQNIDEIGYRLETIHLDETEVEHYYRGLSNEALWPLFHDLLDHCKFDSRHWETYKRVNKKFGDAVANNSAQTDFIWVQDYHLLMVGHFLNEMGLRERSAFFLHIPFPPKDIFIKLPWRQQIMEAFLSYRLVGFQTERDRRNFIHCAKHLLPHVQISHHRKYPYIKSAYGYTRIGSYPISIDFRYFNDLAKSKGVADAAWYIHERYSRLKIVLGVDRLDYTKGIPHRLLAFENCLERYPDLREKISLVQIVVPSRMKVPEYRQMKRQIDELVGRINSRFTRYGWVPIHYIFNTLDKDQLLGYCRAAEIALITPLKDGMNLVAKEYCAACVDNKGILILSEFAGAADKLKSGAILVNPYSIEEVADAIRRAYFMDMDEQQSRMNILRGEIRQNNVFRWVDQFIKSFGYQEDSVQIRPGRSTAMISETIKS